MEPTPKRVKTDTEPHLLLIEPFYGGSHKQMLDLICSNLEPESYILLTLPAKKWKWRLRTSSVYFAEKIPRDHSITTIFCSSMLNLSELLSTAPQTSKPNLSDRFLRILFPELACRPDLIPCKKIVYFHENQFEYPIQPGAEQERDVQFGWSQAVSSMAADIILFNSQFNMNSFFSGLDRSIKLMPKEQQPKSMPSMLRVKSQILYYPLQLDAVPSRSSAAAQEGPLHIVWNHRWEWDKGPNDFFKAIDLLESSGVDFVMSVLGESFGEVPEIFSSSQSRYSHRIRNWGYCASKEEYFDVLLTADVVVSTAHHEFFGVSIVEGIICGCFPLCPNRLVFPEYLPTENLYNTTEQLVKQLRYHARYPSKLRSNSSWRQKIKLDQFDWKISLSEKFHNFIH